MRANGSGEFGPGWYDIASAARVMERRFGVDIVYELSPACPAGHQQVGFYCRVRAWHVAMEGHEEEIARAETYRRAESKASMPAVLYGLLLGKLEPMLDRWAEDQGAEPTPF